MSDPESVEERAESRERSSTSSDRLPARREEAVSHKQAAKVLGVSIRTIRRLVERGELERMQCSEGELTRQAFVTKHSLLALRSQRTEHERDIEWPSEQLDGDSSVFFDQIVQPLNEQLQAAHEELATWRTRAEAETTRREALELEVESLRDHERKRMESERTLAAKIDAEVQARASAEQRALDAERHTMHMDALLEHLVHAGWLERRRLLQQARKNDLHFNK
jgi:excisionase family DNA binding protein